MLPVKLPHIGESALFRNWWKQSVEPNLSRRAIVTHTFGPTADLDNRIRHGLKFVPDHFAVIGIDAAANVYRDSDTEGPDKDFVWLKCDTANVTVSLEIF